MQPGTSKKVPGFFSRMAAPTVSAPAPEAEGDSVGKHTKRITKAALVTAVAVSSSARAQVSGSWVSGSGSWSVGANWTSNPLAPGAGGAATFNNNSAATITLDTRPLLSG